MRRKSSVGQRSVFAAIANVLVGDCAWCQLPPCFRMSKSTAHRRSVIWSRAGVWGRPHEAVLHRLDGASLIDVTRVVLNTAYVTAEEGANTQVRGPWTGRVRLRDARPVGRKLDYPSSSGTRPATSTTVRG